MIIWLDRHISIYSNQKECQYYIVNKTDFLMVMSLNIYHFGKVIYRFERVGR